MRRANMHGTAREVMRLMTRRSRSGQSIIIIALGFIALIAFVGIATDTALLFVRYSTLRRAVDAAAVAAAGQVRENSTYGNVVASAQQYIKIHGLDPASVKVETCETEIYDWIAKNGGTGATAKAALIGAHSELCRPDPAKLVRVSAQINSPTTFLSIIGYKNILLSASSLSQTAVMDVALLLDGSLSTADDTTSLMAASSAALQDRLPGFAVGQPDSSGFTLGLDPYNPAFPGGTGGPRPSIRFECRDATDTPFHKLSNYAFGGCCNDPTSQANVANPDISYYIDAATGAINTSIITSGAPDNNYSDLVCHPFKEVRDATRRFLNRIDFVRGDRVMLVEFDSSINVMTASGPLASNAGAVPVFVTRYDATNALNRFMGIEKNANGSWQNCLTFGASPWIQRQAFYETIAPCPDTNTGGAIQTAQYLLTNPSWIRRDAVWITVLLSDGYPNRTPGLGSSQPATWSPAIHKIPNSGVGPGTATNNPAGNFFDGGILPSTAIVDPGFCPWYTFCDLSSGVANGKPYLATGSVAWNQNYCTENDNEPIWWGSAGNIPGTFKESASVGAPFCSDNNPDSRHFCMNVTSGVINPIDHPEYCSRHYDPDDYARDRVDFAALTDYTSTIKGNFIAMFAIFFPHASNAASNINHNILGVKFMRYLADAGDNGVIDNHLQKWYRNQVQANNLNTDPLPPDASPFNDSTGYNGSLGAYNDTATEDPCAKYDFRELGVLPGSHGAASPDYPDGSGYEDIYKTSCGNYYYAGNPGAVDRAFADIASRLFTRLAR